MCQVLSKWDMMMTNCAAKMIIHEAHEKRMVQVSGLLSLKYFLSNLGLNLWPLEQVV